jgi:hypothetical protein
MPGDALTIEAINRAKQVLQASDKHSDPICRAIPIDAGIHCMTPIAKRAGLRTSTGYMRD